MALKRELSLIEVTLCGIGIILGAGIYALIGEGAALAGNAVWLSFAVSAAIAGITALSYAELSSMYPRAGAEYDYAEQAFGRKAAFIAGWLALFAGLLGATTVAIGFGNYFGAFFSLPWLYGTILIILASAAILFVGVQQSARIGAIITLIEAAGLLYIIYLGVPFIGSVNVLEMPSVSGILSGAVIVFFAFLGFEEMVRLSEETKEPKKTMPRALILAIVFSTILYILVSISAVSIVGWEALAASSSPLALVAEAAAGNTAFGILSVIALFATANTVLLVMLTASRLLYGISESHALPNVLRKTWKNGVPWVAIVVTTILSLAFLALGRIDFVASATNFALFVAFILMNCAVIWLRFSKPKIHREFRTPFSIRKVPILPVLGILFTFVLILNIELNVLVIGIVITGIGVLITLFFE